MAGPMAGPIPFAHGQGIRGQGIQGQGLSLEAKKARLQAAICAQEWYLAAELVGPIIGSEQISPQQRQVYMDYRQRLENYHITNRRFDPVPGCGTADVVANDEATPSGLASSIDDPNITQSSGQSSGQSSSGTIANAETTETMESVEENQATRQDGGQVSVEQLSVQQLDNSFLSKAAQCDEFTALSDRLELQGQTLGQELEAELDANLAILTNPGSEPDFAVMARELDAAAQAIEVKAGRFLQEVGAKLNRLPLQDGTLVDIQSRYISVINRMQGKVMSMAQTLQSMGSIFRSINPQYLSDASRVQQLEQQLDQSEVDMNQAAIAIDNLEDQEKNLITELNTYCGSQGIPIIGLEF
jgi:hypothetical protein